MKNSTRKIIESCVPKNRKTKGFKVSTHKTDWFCSTNKGNNKVTEISVPKDKAISSEFQDVVIAHELLHAKYTRNRGDKTHLNPYLNNVAEDIIISGELFSQYFSHLKHDLIKMAIAEADSALSFPIQQVPQQMLPEMFDRIVMQLCRSFFILGVHGKCLPENEQEMISKKYCQIREHIIALHKFAIKLSVQNQGVKQHELDVDSIAQHYLERIEWNVTRLVKYRSVFEYKYKKGRISLLTFLRQEYHHLSYLLDQLLFKTTEKSGKKIASDFKEERDEEAKKEMGRNINENPIPKYCDKPGVLKEWVEDYAYFAELERTHNCKKTRGDKKPAKSGRKVRASLLHRVKQGKTNGLFRKKSKGHSGAILIDASGSMGCTKERLEKLASLLPAQIIAYYCSSGFTPSSSKVYGHVIIYAKDGRRANQIPLGSSNGGNEVDYAGIEWLLKQKGKLTFITDEGFGGGFECHPDTGHEQCRMAHELLDKNRDRINVIDSIDEAIEIFS